MLPTNHQMCGRCGERWAYMRGLCRTCGKELGGASAGFERDQDALAKQQATRAGVRRVAVAPMRAIVQRFDADVEYEVVWNGQIGKDASH